MEERAPLTVIVAPQQRRKKTFTRDEMRRILDCVQEESEVLLCKKTDSATNFLKCKAWDRVVVSFNDGVELGGVHRDSDSLRAKWSNLKKNARQRCAKLRENAVKTGGGRDYIPRDDILDRVIGMIGRLTVDGIPDDMGSDATLFRVPREEEPRSGRSAPLQPSPAEAPSGSSRRPDPSGLDDILPYYQSEETESSRLEETSIAAGDSARRRPPSSEDEDPYGRPYRRQSPAAAEVGPSRPSGSGPSRMRSPEGRARAEVSRSRSLLRRTDSSLAERRQMWADAAPASLRTRRSTPLRARNENRNRAVSPLTQTMMDRNKHIGEYYRMKKEYYAAKLALLTRSLRDENQPPP